MITGFIVIDEDNNLVFDLNHTMKSSLTGHEAFFNGMTSNSVVLYGKTAYKTFKQPPHDTARVHVDEPLLPLVRENPLTPITIVGNNTVLKYEDKLDNLVVVKYKSKGIRPGKSKFELPDDARVLGNFVTFDIYQVDIEHERDILWANEPSDMGSRETREQNVGDSGRLQHRSEALSLHEPEFA